MNAADPTYAPRTSVAPTGRLRQVDVPSTDRNYSIAMHLLPLAVLLPIGQIAIFAPPIMWLFRREQSSFNDDHGREVLNMLITGLIFTIGLGLIPIVGWIALIVWYIVTGVGMIRGAAASSRGEFFRYPMVIRFVS